MVKIKKVIGAPVKRWTVVGGQKTQTTVAAVTGYIFPIGLRGRSVVIGLVPETEYIMLTRSSLEGIKVGDEIETAETKYEILRIVPSGIKAAGGFLYLKVVSEE